MTKLINFVIAFVYISASLYRWSTPCVLLLLESYRAMEKDFNSGKISQKKVWEKVAKELKVKGHDVTGPQCSSKLRSLKKSYKSIKDHNGKSGNDRRTWQFFDVRINSIIFFLTLTSSGFFDNNTDNISLKLS